jgi:hypothetical protein
MTRVAVRAGVGTSGGGVGDGGDGVGDGVLVCVTLVLVPVDCVVLGASVGLVIVLVMCGLLVECVWLLEDLGPVLVVSVILMMGLVLLPVVCVAWL